MLYGQLRKNLGEVFHDLARQKESRILDRFDFFIHSVLYPFFELANKTAEQVYNKRAVAERRVGTDRGVLRGGVMWRKWTGTRDIIKM